MKNLLFLIVTFGSLGCASNSQLLEVVGHKQQEIIRDFLSLDELFLGYYCTIIPDNENRNPPFVENLLIKTDPSWIKLLAIEHYCKSRYYEPLAHEGFKNQFLGNIHTFEEEDLAKVIAEFDEELEKFCDFYNNPRASEGYLEIGNSIKELNELNARFVLTYSYAPKSRLICFVISRSDDYRRFTDYYITSDFYPQIYYFILLDDSRQKIAAYFSSTSIPN